MGFLKTANAVVEKTKLERDDWNQVRKSSSYRKAGFQQRQSSDVDLNEYSPDDYLLTHSTIIASVDTKEVPNIKTGEEIQDGKGREIFRPFNDYRIAQDTEKFINQNCFPSGSMVTMADGSEKPIEEIEEGEEVLTHRGRTKKVTETFEREYEGTVVSVDSIGSPSTITATDEHPFFAFRPEEECVNCEGEIDHHAPCISNLFERNYCSRDCYYDYGKTNEDLLEEKEGKFVEASELKEKFDYLTNPVIEETKEVGLNENKARLVGLFLAEGYYDVDSRDNNARKAPMFAYHQEETGTLARRTLDLMKEEFGVEGKIHHHLNDRGIHVSFPWDEDLVEFFTKWVKGSDATEKKLHGDLLKASKDIQKEVVRGWFEGDGSVFGAGEIDQFRLSGASASRDLINQISLLLTRLGVHSYTQHEESDGRKRENGSVVSDASSTCESWIINVGAAWARDLVKNTVFADDYFRLVEKQGGVQSASDLRFMKGSRLEMLEAAEEEYFEGKVYNIEVEEDHSYVVEGRSVHNCDSWERDLLLQTYDSFIGAENYCFEGSTPVMMEDGSYKSIEDIEEGDKVVTHSGDTREVTHTFEREVDENILEIQVDRYDDPVRVTKNHPFRKIEVEYPEFNHRSSTSESTKQRYQKDQRMKYLRGDSDAKKGFDSELVWEEAGSLKEGDFVVSPEEPSVEARISEEKAKILGHYLAEGCLLSPEDPEGVIITPGVHEDEVVEDLTGCVSAAFPSTEIRVSETDTSTYRVSLRGEEIGEWCKEHGGHLAHRKSLSSEVFQWDRSTLKTILTMWLNGDGDFHKRTSRLRGNTVSEDLVHQMLRICDILGIRSSITKTDRDHIKDNEVDIDGYGEHTISSNHDLWQIHISKEDSEVLLNNALRWDDVDVESSAKSREFSFWEGKRTHRVDSIEEVSHEGKVHNIEVEGDHSYVISPGIAVHNCEHVQIPEKSKGKVIDAVARDLDDTVYIDILVATNRDHNHLVSSIESGEMDTLSMGCSISYSLCTKCGNLAADETDMCPHIRHMKGEYFEDEDGVSRKVAELCGHRSDPDSVNFIEASWVASPAFDGAVMRKILGEDEINENPSVEESLSQKIEQAHSMGNFNTGGSSMDQFLAKSANQEGVREKIRGGLREGVKAALKDKAASSDDILPDQKDDPNDFNSRSHKVNTSEKYSQAWGDGGGQEDQQQQTDDRDLVEKLVDELKGVVFDEAKQELSETIEDHGKFQEFEDNPYSDSTLNNNIQHSRLLTTFKAFDQKYGSHLNNFHKKRDVFLSLWKAGQDGWSSLREADCLDNPSIVSAIYLKDTKMSDRQASLSMEDYQCLAYVGGTQNYRNKEAFLKACTSYLGRQPTKKESKAMIRRAKYLH